MNLFKDLKLESKTLLTKRKPIFSQQQKSRAAFIQTRQTPGHSVALNGVASIAAAGEVVALLQFRTALLGRFHCIHVSDTDITEWFNGDQSDNLHLWRRFSHEVDGIRHTGMIELRNAQVQSDAQLTTVPRHDGNGIGDDATKNLQRKRRQIIYKLKWRFQMEEKRNIRAFDLDWLIQRFRSFIDQLCHPSIDRLIEWMIGQLTTCGMDFYCIRAKLFYSFTRDYSR